MTFKTLNGDRAIAHGALASGVSLVTSYPGSKRSPSPYRGNQNPTLFLHLP